MTPRLHMRRMIATVTVSEYGSSFGSHRSCVGGTVTRSFHRPGRSTGSLA